jgi:hypothetical protein
MNKRKKKSIEHFNPPPKKIKGNKYVMNSKPTNQPLWTKGFEIYTCLFHRQVGPGK